MSSAARDERILRDLILALSARLAAVLEDDVDAAVSEALGLVGSQTGADRAYVMRFDYAARTFDNTHEWVADGVEPERERVQRRPLAWMAPWRGAFALGDAVSIDDVRTLRGHHDELLAELEAQSIVSVLWVPLPGPREPLGFVGFDAVHVRPAWSDVEVDLLRSAANVIAGALARVDAVVERDRVSERLRAVAELVPGVVYQYLVDVDGRSSYPYVSPGVTTLMGVSPAALRESGTAASERIHPDDRGRLKVASATSMHDLSTWRAEFRVRDSNERWRWVRGIARPRRLEDGATLWYGVLVDVTEEHTLAEALRQRKHDLARITETLRDVVVLTDPDLTVRYVSPSVQEVLGYDPEAVVGRRVTEFLHPGEIEIAERHLANGFRDRDGSTLVHRMLHADGSVRYFESLIHVLEGEGAVFSARDVTERVAYQQRLEREVAFRGALVALTNDMLADTLDEGFYQQVLEQAIALVPDAEGGSLLIQDEDGSFRFVAAVGFDSDALRALRLRSDQLASRPSVVARVDVRALGPDMDLEPQQLEAFERAGRYQDIAATLSVPITSGGAPRGYMHLDNFADAEAFDQDSHELAAAFSAQVGVALQRLHLERELQLERNRYERLASHDALTGLPNRRLFQDRLDQALTRAQRYGHHVALVYVDLDGFKNVNDDYGHGVGDELLTLVAQRLVDQVRAQDTVARLGGDEFALVLGDVPDRAAAEAVVEKVLASLRAPFVVRGEDVCIGASVGVALSPDDGLGHDALMKAADTAMYSVKRAGKGRFAFFADGVEV